MAKWYYYTRGGEQIGPVSTETLKSLTKQGVISKDTIIENERGVKRNAGSVAGFEFGIEPYKISEDLSSAFAQPDSAQPNSFPDIPPLAKGQMNEPQFPPLPQSSTVNLPPNSVYVPQREKPFLRFIYIFLAVFVGIFGIHDFYVKRKREGWIHLWLLSPYLIPFICSILAVPLWTIYTICYPPNMLNIMQCKSEIAAKEREITDAEQKLAKEKQQRQQQIDDKQKKLDDIRKNFEDALDGKYKIPPAMKQPERPQEQPQERPKWQPTEQPQKPLPTKEPIKSDVKQPERPQERPKWQPTEPSDEYTLKVLREQIDTLLREIAELSRAAFPEERIIASLQSEINELTARIAALEVERKVINLRNWITTGELWIYCIFVLLPFFSWVMAMYEIVTVTKDGRGIELE